MIKRKSVAGVVAKTLGVLGLLTMPAQAMDDKNAVLSDSQLEAITCMDGLNSGTTWGQCMGILFGGCAGNDVGSEPHLACLLAQREVWMTSLEDQQAVVIGQLNDQGVTELSQVMTQWFGHVAQKCAGVGAGKVGSSAGAAQVGCEIAEMAGVVTELVACEEGRSAAPYCQAKE